MRTIWLIATIWMLGCSGADNDPVDAGEDLDTDLGTDLSQVDSGADLGSDAGTDLGLDLMTDTGTDMGTDLQVDAGFDLGFDLGFDTTTDLETDLQEDAGFDVDVQVCTNCQLPEPLWAVSVGGAFADLALAVATSPDGSVTLGGHTGSPKLHVDGIYQATTGVESKRKVFVTHQSAEGDPVWTRIFGGPGDDRLRAVASDSTGHILIGGLTIQSPLFAFGDTVFQPNAKMDGYFARLTPGGQVVFANLFGEEKDEVVLAVAADYDNNVLVGGYFSSPSVNLGSGPVQNTQDIEQYDLLVAKTGPEGEVYWTRAWGGYGFDYIHSIAADLDGNIYITGGTSVYGLTIGNQVLQSHGDRDIWVAKLSPTGEPQWAHIFGGENHDASHALAVSPAGDVYVTGSLQSEMVNFGGSNIYHVGSKEHHDIFLIKLDTNGNHVWSQGFGGPDWDLAKSVTLGPDETVFITGAFNSPTLSLGGDPLTGPGPGGRKVEALAAAFSPDGQHLWSYAFGGPDDDMGYWVSANAGGALSIGGTFNGTSDGEPPPEGTMDAGTGPLAVTGGRDSFAVRLY